MCTQSTTQRFLFPEISDKPVWTTFDREHASSDGGAVLLKATDRRLGLIGHLGACLQDGRQPGKVRHELAELLSQRIFGIACGYPDGNDAARLAHDPIHKLLVGRNPTKGAALGSQPTLSRFENGVGPRELYRLGDALAEKVVERHRRRLRGRARLITIDLDPTDDPTHGAQQLSFFNGHYNSWCYLPLLGFLRFGKEREQYLFAALLRPGNVSATVGSIAILRRILTRLRQAFPRARFIVRLDGGFASPQVFEFLDAEPRLGYVVAMAKNSVLKRRAARLMGRARRRSRESGETEHVYGDTHYAARRWSHARRVIFKAEVVRDQRNPDKAPRDNPRFMVTNLRQSPRWIYEHIYCQRGDIENRIKELHDGLQIDRTSCSRFWANQFRVLLTAAAFVLMQELRHAARHTACARAQVTTLRERLLKLGVQVTCSMRRIVLHFPRTFPFLDTWQRIAQTLGAKPG